MGVGYYHPANQDKRRAKDHLIILQTSIFSVIDAYLETKKIDEKTKTGKVFDVSMNEVITICLPLPYKLGTVNCYLLKTDTGYILIDTGYSNNRIELEKELERAGCKPGNLNLIILTHGDFDHTGNAAYLREKFAAKIAMHYDDSGMSERGDMFWNRKKGNILLGKIAVILFKFGKRERFKLDLCLDEGYDLSEYRIDAKVLHIPGHSKGSIGILTADGCLFCGDLLENKDKPTLSSIMDDLTVAKQSINKLKKLRINTIYPGHGRSFSMELLMKQF